MIVIKIFLFYFLTSTILSVDVPEPCVDETQEKYVVELDSTTHCFFKTRLRASEIDPETNRKKLVTPSKYVIDNYCNRNFGYYATLPQLKTKELHDYFANQIKDDNNFFGHDFIPLGLTVKEIKGKTVDIQWDDQSRVDIDAHNVYNHADQLKKVSWHTPSSDRDQLTYLSMKTRSGSWKTFKDISKNQTYSVWCHYIYGTPALATGSATSKIYDKNLGSMMAAIIFFAIMNFK